MKTETVNAVEESRFAGIFSGNDAPIAPVKNAKIEKKAPIKQPEQAVNEKRTNIEMPLVLHEKLTIMAHLEFSTIKRIINEAVEKTIVQYEKTHGELKRVPKSQRTK
jgi:hypothetical protein